MTTAYAPPLRDIRFVLDHLVGLPEIATWPGLEHSDPDTVADLLEEFGRLMADVVAPLNGPADKVGSVHDARTGAVTTPEGFIGAYRQYVEGGWGGVPFEAEHGGGGFPWLVGLAMQELLTSASMAFSMAPLLTQGAIDALTHHADAELQATYLPKMVSGQWTGTMNLTEPEAGSDVGALRTKAIPAGDGSWRIFGQKIFITFGDHDLAENIVHLVLARVPDAPAGTKGISLFVVPKFLVDAEGNPGAANDVKVVSIEHKMGIKASPTCVMAYGDGGDGAVGYLVGEANAGMRYMFTMMNNARLSVGLEGLSVSERAYQQTVAFASERRQGRALGAPAGASSPIVDHADVRRMLLTMRSHVEAMRVLLFANAAAIDGARHHPDADQRVAAQERADLLTPLSKGWCTDVGNEVTSLAIQVHGGMGFIEETGVAQHYRDIRIAAIYEGTNGIQAMDLVGRKLGLRAGGVMADHLTWLTAMVDEAAGLDGWSSADSALRGGLAALLECVQWLSTKGLSDPVQALAGATPFLRVASVVTAGALMAHQAATASRLLTSGSADADGFLAAKVVTARFFCEQVVPQAAALVPAVTAGSDDLFALTPEHLASR